MTIRKLRTEGRRGSVETRVDLTKAAYLVRRGSRAAVWKLSARLQYYLRLIVSTICVFGWFVAVLTVVNCPFPALRPILDPFAISHHLLSSADPMAAVIAKKEVGTKREN
ncbi:hypothetical protein Amn_18800 [Aminobacter sp. Y103A]|nr:hypothetical protein Amn_18800 [Aminobacter sp. SS-2016]